MKRLMLLATTLSIWLFLMTATPVSADEAVQPTQAPNMPQQAMAQAQAPMTDIHDIAPPLFTGLSSGVKKAMAYGGIAAALILLGLAGLWLWFRKKQGPKMAPEIFQPPDVLALMALDRIESLMDRDGKGFYFELSETAKHYLKGRFGLDAPEMTAEELLPELKNLPVTSDQRQLVATLFAHAEPVKFAGVTPDPGAMAEDIASVRRFVTETAPVEVAEENAKSMPPAAR